MGRHEIFFVVSTMISQGCTTTYKLIVLYVENIDIMKIMTVMTNFNVKASLKE